ncbi:hypothetical protein 8G_00049 [Ralstonia phage Hyacinthe]|uniref:HNH nuclease domain-containing protein n=3 Tax=Rahariannevirus raharianne TaxID=2846050 RepID=A0A7G5BBG4_9CAUD|nr:hypothetical protein KMC43_gp68 [Ralstonia phage Raharianne]QMV32443.1 hypothetical protein U2_00068 [Ralstonia phage Albius]QMV33481.1 hypothetical protein 8G_00049 [Ralstonia phage Hyacinthe]QMV33637.1 hypothetical protein Y2_00068 [Ralstonia phage Raharianne]
MSNIAAELTADSVRELLDYDPSTGAFRWRKTGKGRRLDLAAGSPDRHGYLQTRINGRIYFNHRLAWLYMFGTWPEFVIDHINGNPSDNRIDNLRDVPRKTNQENQRKAASSNKTTGLLGASLHKGTGKFVAAIQSGRRSRYLGLHETPELAHEAYLSAKRTMHEGATI